ncbi:MAG: collagen-binding domain-containing protein [Wujia sp.]
MKKKGRKKLQVFMVGITISACSLFYSGGSYALENPNTSSDANYEQIETTESDSQNSEEEIASPQDATQTDGTKGIQPQKKQPDIPDIDEEKKQEENKIKYAGDYSLEYILGHYSYFVEENLTGDEIADTIGPVVVGKDLNLKNTIGKVKAAASYAKNLIDLTDYYAGAWNDTSGIDTNFYYENNYMKDKDWLVNRMILVDEAYINMNEAFDNIEKQSKQISNQGTKNAYSWEENTIVLDFDKSHTFTIDGKDYETCDGIKIIHAGEDALLHGTYSISINGESDFLLDSSKIKIDGIALNNNYLMRLVEGKEGNVQNGQYYPFGMGLLWNFPDAKSVRANFLAGHLLVPNGDVSLCGGNHEGQVIAKNVNTKSEGHFYPYITPQPTPSETPSETPQPTPSETPSETPQPTPSETPSETPQPTPSETPGGTPQPTPSEPALQEFQVYEIPDETPSPRVEQTTQEQSEEPYVQEEQRQMEKNKTHEKRTFEKDTLVVPSKEVPKTSSTHTTKEVDTDAISTGDKYAIGFVVVCMVISGILLLILSCKKKI